MKIRTRGSADPTRKNGGKRSYLNRGMGKCKGPLVKDKVNRGATHGKKINNVGGLGLSLARGGLQVVRH